MPLRVRRCRRRRGGDRARAVVLTPGSLPRRSKAQWLRRTAGGRRKKKRDVLAEGARRDGLNPPGGVGNDESVTPKLHTEQALIAPCDGCDGRDAKIK
jgi:hypothetical protein